MFAIPHPAVLLLSASLLVPAALQAQTSQPRDQGSQSERQSSARDPSMSELGAAMGEALGQMGRMMGDMAQTMGGSMQRMLDAMQKEGLRGTKNEHIEGKLAFLKAELHITAAQETAWTAFADAMRKAAAMAPAAAARAGQGDTLPDRLDEQTRLLQARLATLEAKKAAIDRLYTKLDSRQKTLADDLIEQIGLV